MLVREHELLLDRLIHEPARLAILTVLSSVEDADFTFLQRTTGLTKGNLSSHLTKLETAGLVQINKTFVGKRPNTKVALTPVRKAGGRPPLAPIGAPERPLREPGVESRGRLAGGRLGAPRVVNGPRLDQTK